MAVLILSGKSSRSASIWPRAATASVFDQRVAGRVPRSMNNKAAGERRPAINDEQQQRSSAAASTPARITVRSSRRMPAWIITKMRPIPRLVTCSPTTSRTSISPTSSCTVVAPDVPDRHRRLALRRTQPSSRPMNGPGSPHRKTCRSGSVRFSFFARLALFLSTPSIGDMRSPLHDDRSGDVRHDAKRDQAHPLQAPPRTC